MAEVLENELRGLIASIIEVEPQKITAATSMTKDLGIDSMLALEIMAALEKKYKIEIPEQELLQLDSLAQTTALVNKHLEEKAVKA